MKVAVIKEIKTRENRVALTPAGARALINAGHDVAVERGAGVNSGFGDALYAAEGADIVETEDAWRADLIMKIKEPQQSEYAYFREGQIIFTYFHLAGVDPSLTDQLLEKKVTAIAYETVRDEQGKLPLLAPMSAVAGCMSISIANTYLARHNGGRGVLLGALFGERHGKAVVLGDGVVGWHAAKTAYAMGADTYLFSRHEERFTSYALEIGADLNCVLSSEETIAEHVANADAVIGAVLLAGGRAPHIVSEAMVKSMQKGSVIVDVSIDQGGCIETSRPTTHVDPVFDLHGVTHYCVTNMPGAYPLTSTKALTGATLPYAVKIADEGLTAAKDDEGFAQGVNTYDGVLTNKAVAEALSLTSRYQPLETLLS